MNINVPQTIVEKIRAAWNMSAGHFMPPSKDKKKSALDSNGLLICRGVECPYRAVCDIPDEDIEAAVNGTCLKEVAVLVVRFAGYCKEFEIEDHDTVDIQQVRQLVDIEIKLIRCNKFTSANPHTIIYETAYGNGERKLHPIALYELKLLNQHSRLLKDLVATRYTHRQPNPTQCSYVGVIERAEKKASINTLIGSKAREASPTGDMASLRNLLTLLSGSGDRKQEIKLILQILDNIMAYYKDKP